MQICLVCWTVIEALLARMGMKLPYMISSYYKRNIYSDQSLSLNIPSTFPIPPTLHSILLTSPHLCPRYFTHISCNSLSTNTYPWSESRTAPELRNWMMYRVASLSLQPLNHWMQSLRSAVEIPMVLDSWTWILTWIWTCVWIWGGVRRGLGVWRGFCLFRAAFGLWCVALFWDVQLFVRWLFVVDGRKSSCLRVGLRALIDVGGTDRV